MVDHPVFVGVRRAKERNARHKSLGRGAPDGDDAFGVPVLARYKVDVDRGRWTKARVKRYQGTSKTKLLGVVKLGDAESQVTTGGPELRTIE